MAGGGGPGKRDHSPTLACGVRGDGSTWPGRAATRPSTCLPRSSPPRAAPVTLNERSARGPSLATAEDLGNLVLAWTGRGRGANHVNLLTLPRDSDGTPVPLAGAQTRFEEARSGSGPAVCSHQGGLVLAWTGTRPPHQHLGRCRRPVWCACPAGRGRGPATRPRSAATRAACSSWPGRAIDRHINVLTAAESPYGAPVRLEEAKSSYAPALCSHKGSLIVTWSGAHDHLNLAHL